MPNWRNPADYVFPARLPNRRWAWEFLRRNPAYRRDWEAALGRYIARTGEFRELPNPSKIAEETEPLVFMLRDRDPSDPEFRLPVVEAERWRLTTGLFNPATDFPRTLNFDPNLGLVHVMKRGESLASRGTDYPLAEFNLHLPLRPQFAAMLRYLELTRKALEIQPLRAVHHRKLWPTYLRYLDADLDERTPKQIADALESEADLEGLDERKVWDRLQAARKMVEPAGYLSIFFSRSSTEKLKG